MPTITPLAPGAVSPRLPVPASIARPEYVDRPAPAPFRGSEVKDAATIEAMRVAARRKPNEVVVVCFSGRGDKDLEGGVG